MGAKQSINNNDSLNWDKINTESMSSTVPNLSNINKDAQKLLSSLDIKKEINLEDTDSENDNLFTWIKTKIGNEPTVNNLQEDTLSDTSPFISSEMYKYLADKKNSVTSEVLEQKGGAEDSSTSSTSSTPRSKKETKKQKGYEDSSSVMSAGDLSYLSSSAHTENKSSEIEETSLSVQNKNTLLSSSVNTSDINYISNDSN